MGKINNRLINLIVILSFGLVLSIFCQFLAVKPTARSIHIRNFRYGKDPSVIRCNRGDTLHLTFSSDDTGHSFFLEEFDMDVKVTPASKDVSVFKTSDPTLNPEITSEVVLKTQHPGMANYLVSKSNFRCHVWCGPMHAFEQGKLVIFPNTLLFFSLGCLIGILFLWLRSFFRVKESQTDVFKSTEKKDLLAKYPFLRKILHKRWPQVILIILSLTILYVVIITTIFGTKVSGRNLGVLLMWAVWLFLLVAILTPFFGRLWCTICPMPFFGDWIQRGSLFAPAPGKTKAYNNLFSGLFMKWPKTLENSWLRVGMFMILSTFSTTLVAKPWVSGMAVILFILIPTLMAFVWELRAFCRYVCPVSVFVAPFSELSTIAIEPKDQEVCNKCKPHFCQSGSAGGWACPYGINVGKMNGSADCGMCLECIRSCSYKNVSLVKRKFGGETVIRNTSEAWQAIAIFSMSVVYSLVYLGTWPSLRDYVNILDKQNWGLFAIFSFLVWIIVLAIVPGLIYSLAIGGHRLSGKIQSAKDLFFGYCATLLPLGLMIWISFVIPMLFVNVTFIAQSASDPFGWGWDFFGTSNIPWHQFMPSYIPWMQAILVLTGLSFSLRNLKRRWDHQPFTATQSFRLSLPMALLLVLFAVFMLFFFTN